MNSANEPVTVRIPHKLGREEAKRRIDRGLAAVRSEVAPYVRSLDYAWQGDRLDFRASVMLQTIAGCIEVFDEVVRVEFALPRLLHFLARTIAGRIEHRGSAMLEPPKE